MSDMSDVQDITRAINNIRALKSMPIINTWDGRLAEELASSLLDELLALKREVTWRLMQHTMRHE